MRGMDRTRAEGVAALFPMTALATSLAAMLDFVPLLGVADWRATDGKEVSLTSVLPCRMYLAACASDSF